MEKKDNKHIFFKGRAKEKRTDIEIVNIVHRLAGAAAPAVSFLQSAEKRNQHAHMCTTLLRKPPPPKAGAGRIGQNGGRRAF